MRISDWSSDVCSSDLVAELLRIASGGDAFIIKTDSAGIRSFVVAGVEVPTDRHGRLWVHYAKQRPQIYVSAKDVLAGEVARERLAGKFALIGTSAVGLLDIKATRSEEHTSELQSLMRISYAVFCLKKK